MPNPGLSEDVARETVEAIREHGNVSAAAVALGISRNTLQSRWERIRAEPRLAHLLTEPAHVIETPEYVPPAVADDKPSLDDVLARKREEFRRRHAAEQSRRWMRFRIRADGPFALAFFGDPHLDDGGCNFPLLERDLALLRDTPSLFGVGMGDYTNNWAGRLQRLYANQETTRSQGWLLAQWFFGQKKPSGQSAWLALIKGNHDLWSGSADPLDWMMRGAAPLEDWQMRFEVAQGERAWRIHAAHDFKGNSIWNPGHGPLRKGAFDGQADLYVCGHKHNWICTELESQEQPGRVYWATRCRGYKYIDHFADQCGYGAQDYGATIVMVCDPAKHGPSAQRCFPDIAEAVDWLTFLRRRHESGGRT